MLEDFVVWLLASYGCSALFVSLCHRLVAYTCTFVGVAEPAVHYQVLLRNSELTLESVVRTLLLQSSMEGKPIRISFVDEGSTDQTLKMTQLVARCYAYLTVEPDHMPASEQEHTVTIDLRRS